MLFRRIFFLLLFVYLCFHVQRDGSSPVDCWWVTLSERKNAWQESVCLRRAPFRHQGFSQQVRTTSCLLHCCILTLGFCFPAPHDVELWAQCSFCPPSSLMSLSRVTKLHPPLSRTLDTIPGLCSTTTTTCILIFFWNNLSFPDTLNLWFSWQGTF